MSEKKLLSFNGDNLDVYDLINEKANASEYVCRAVRFYEQFKNSSADVNNTIQIAPDSNGLEREIHLLRELTQNRFNQLEEMLNKTQVNDHTDTLTVLDPDLLNQIRNEDD